MAGKREGTVTESVDQLYQLLDRQQCARRQARIRMLLLFKEDESKTMVEVARLTNRCERLVRRWWRIYREGGAEALLAGKPGAVVGTRPVENRIVDNGSVDNRIRRDGKLAPQFVGFLNALPYGCDTLDWIKRFRDLFTSLFSDIDRISVNIDIDAKLGEWDGAPVTYVTQNVSFEGAVPIHLQTTVNMGSSSSGDKVGEAMRRERSFMEKYSAPHRFDYHTTQGAYLGSILLWREKPMGPISEATLQSVRDLAPFLTFMLSDCIARRQAEDPGVRVFTETLSTIADRENLTERQQEVLAHGLLGRTHAQTGAALGITAHAVRGHICALHRKTDTRSLLELFARYFTPFQDPHDRRRS